MPTVYAYEIIFNTPAKELFAGAYDMVYRDVRERAGRLLKILELERGNDPRTMQKLKMLRTLVESQPNAAEGS